MSINIVETISACVKVPDELVSENEHDRFHHFDLPDRAEEDLRRELAFTRWVNYITDSSWHRDRESAIGLELRRRHDAQRARRTS